MEEAEVALWAAEAILEAVVDKADALPLVVAVAAVTTIGERRENADGGGSDACDTESDHAGEAEDAGGWVPPTVVVATVE